jgi:hypothetical protein
MLVVVLVALESLLDGKRRSIQPAQNRIGLIDFL